MSKRTVRRLLWERQGGKCYYCAQPTAFIERKHGTLRKNEATLDHIIPLASGGRKAPTLNCVVACNQCNQERGTTDARIFLLQKMGLA